MPVYLSSISVRQSHDDRARIGYRSVLPAATLSGTAGQPGYPLSAITNPATYERYRPTALPASIQVDCGAAMAVDYIGIAAHTLGSSGCTVVLESSTNQSTWTNRLTISPGSDETIMGFFGQVSERYWRIRITGPVVPLVGVVYLGAALTMQRELYGGHTPLVLARMTAVRPNLSETGQWLGASQTRAGFGTSFAWRHLTAAWYRAEFDPFVATNPRVRPFFIAWRPHSFPSEVGYCWATEDIAPQNMGIRDLMSVDMRVEAFRDRE